MHKIHRNDRRLMWWSLCWKPSSRTRRGSVGGCFELLIFFSGRNQADDGTHAWTPSRIYRNTIITTFLDTSVIIEQGHSDYFWQYSVGRLASAHVHLALPHRTYAIFRSFWHNNSEILASQFQMYFRRFQDFVLLCFNFQACQIPFQISITSAIAQEGERWFVRSLAVWSRWEGKYVTVQRADVSICPLLGHAGRNSNGRGFKEFCQVKV